MAAATTPDGAHGAPGPGAVSEVPDRRPQLGSHGARSHLVTCRLLGREDLALRTGRRLVSQTWLRAERRGGAAPCDPQVGTEASGRPRACALRWVPARAPWGRSRSAPGPPVRPAPVHPGLPPRPRPLVTTPRAGQPLPRRPHPLAPPPQAPRAPPDPRPPHPHTSGRAPFPEGPPWPCLAPRPDPATSPGPGWFAGALRSLSAGGAVQGAELGPKHHVTTTPALGERRETAPRSPSASPIGLGALRPPMATRAAPRRGRRAPQDYKSQTAPRGRPETAGDGGRLGQKAFSDWSSWLASRPWSSRAARGYPETLSPFPSPLRWQVRCHPRASVSHSWNQGGRG